MLAELGKKAQITIPGEIVEKLGLVVGDKFEVCEKNGVIYLIPAAVYPKKYVEELRREIDGVKSDIACGKKPVFDNIDKLLEKLRNG